MKSRYAATIVLAALIPFGASSVLAQDAAATFKARCAPCHGQDGSGNTPMGKKVGARALGSPEVQNKTDSELMKFISAGKGKMPSFSKQLKSGEVIELVKLIRGFQTK